MCVGGGGGLGEGVAFRSEEEGLELGVPAPSRMTSLGKLFWVMASSKFHIIAFSCSG